MPLSTVALDALDAHVAYFRALTQRGGGTAVDHGGIVSWRSTHPMPFLVNVVFRVDPAVDAAEVLNEADRRFVTGYEVVTVVDRDEDLFDLAVELGAHGEEPGPIQVLADPSSVGKPQGGQAQFVERLRPEASGDQLAALRDWMLENLALPLDLDIGRQARTRVAANAHPQVSRRDRSARPWHGSPMRASTAPASCWRSRPNLSSTSAA